MIISVIGSGGREHAICKKISESPQASKIYWKLKKLRSEASLDMSATNPDEDAHYKSFATRGVLDQLAAFVEQTNAAEDG